MLKVYNEFAQYKCFLLILVVLIVLTALTHKLVKQKKTLKIIHHLVGVSLILLCVFCGFKLNSLKTEFVETLEEKYKITVHNLNLTLEDNIPSHVTVLSENSVYDMYLVKKNEDISLYTKNNGTYLPITNFSKEVL